MPKLWIPGPIEVRPAILAECSSAQISHRGKEMDALFARIDPLLPLPFGLEPGSTSRVAVHTCSGTGLMEAALHGVGPRTLHLVNGAFSKRWLEIARAIGKQARSIDVALGGAVEPAALERALAEHGPFDAVTLTANETSTGVRTPVAPIGEVVRRAGGALLLVDAVSLLGGAPVDFDAWGLDFAFASSQKALALPPGIAVCCASERYVERARSIERRSFYLDPLRILDGHAERNTPSTPCLPLYFALAKELEDVSAGATLPASERGPVGRDAWLARFAEHERMQAQTIAWAARHGLELLPRREHASPTVSCLRAGALDVERFASGLKKAGHVISNGYGELKNETFRIGHMGDHTRRDLDELLDAADQVIAGL